MFTIPSILRRRAAHATAGAVLAAPLLTGCCCLSECCSDCVDVAPCEEVGCAAPWPAVYEGEVQPLLAPPPPSPHEIAPPPAPPVFRTGERPVDPPPLHVENAGRTTVDDSL